MTKNHLAEWRDRSEERGRVIISQRRDSHMLGTSGAARPLIDKNRLLMLAENIGNMGHWGWDLANDSVVLSAQVLEIMGNPSPAPATLDDILALSHPEDRAGVRQQLDDAVAAGTGFEFDVRVRHTDGGYRTFIVKGQPEYDGARRVIAMYGVTSDVTEAFAAINALQDRTEMLGLAAELAHMGHWVWATGGLSYCSDEMARLHRLSPESFLGRYTNPEDIAQCVSVEHRDRYRDIVRRAIANGHAYETEYRLELPDGTRRDIREIGQPIFSDSGRFARFIATAQDISEAKQREAELTRAKARLEVQAAELQELNLQKDKLFSIIAHDLRSPFNSVIGFADLLATKAHELSPGKVASYAQIVREAAGGVHDLLDNLLAWASYQIRDTALKAAPFELAQAAAGSLEPFVHMAEAKGITIANGISGVWVLADEALVRIVIRNLVSNAIKFSRNGGFVRLSAASVDDPKPMVRVTVRDDGVGIPAGADLFQLGGSDSSPGTRGEKGTGLGLYLCRDIITRHGGAITAESEAGAGAAFHFTVPRAAGPAA